MASASPCCVIAATEDAAPGEHTDAVSAAGVTVRQVSHVHSSPAAGPPPIRRSPLPAVFEPTRPIDGELLSYYEAMPTAEAACRRGELFPRGEVTTATLPG
ncbi:hypothetical protein ACGFOU_10765 [Streptomyces sp. NPDC048595]|uniref:hypothetical protein n=1 Tax=Streptomyces sp. NPDC048595 TaxID=3365576 RepID=UPI00371C3995